MSDAEVDVVNSLKWKRPRWDQINDYQGHVEWSNRRWAWEYLRRNPEYQAIPLGLMGPKREIALAKFGRTNLKDYNEEYDVMSSPSDEDWNWKPEKCAGFRRLPAWAKLGDKTKVELHLKLGQLAVIFDLAETVRAGPSAIEAMLTNARAELKKELNRYSRQLALSKLPGPQVRKPRRERFLPRLRLCDALHQGADEKEILDKLYFKNKATAKRRLKEDMAALEEILNGGYLYLVPLDHLQKKAAVYWKPDAVDKEMEA